MIEEARTIILALMRLKQVNRAGLAKRMGKSRSYVTQMLSGDRNLTLATLDKIADALEVDFHLVWVDKE